MVFENYDIAIFDVNTLECALTADGKTTGHNFYVRLSEYVDAIEPNKDARGRTFITHMSGHEDGPGNRGYGWTDDEWENAAKKDHIHVAKQGMILPLTL